MFQGAGVDRTGSETLGELVVVTETRIYIGISKQKPSDLFAGKWLRAPDLSQRPRTSGARAKRTWDHKLRLVG
jgi:hypothetical protein